MSDTTKPDDGHYEVGYKKPPKASQFKKGQSGNKSGRPKGSKNISTLIAQSLAQKITVTENGRTKKITKAEAGAKNLASMYAKGDLRAMAQVHQIQGLMTVDDSPTTVVEPDEVLLQNVLARLYPPPLKRPAKPRPVKPSAER